METCDVLIVGGGPAGSTLAWKLAGSSLDVLVMDKAQFPRDKLCAGWITPAVVNSLELDTTDYEQKNVFQPLNGFRIARLGAKHTETQYGEAVSYGIRRREFDHYLLDRCGARTVLGEPVKSIERHGAHMVVNNRYRTKLLIGAGGHFCPVARFLGNRPGAKETIVAAQEVEFLMNSEQQKQCQVKADTPELYFCKDLAGYAWVFRKGDYLNIGLGREDNHKLAVHVSDFVQELKKLNRIPQDIPGRFHGHAYLLYGHAPRLSMANNVMLIGDALGLAYPQSGEGIRPAIESAIMAADVILTSQGEYSLTQLASFDDEIVKRFGKTGGLSPLEWIPPVLVQGIAGSLLANAWFARNVVMDRWFLHRQQAPLVSKFDRPARLH